MIYQNLKKLRLNLFIKNINKHYEIWRQIHEFTDNHSPWPADLSFPEMAVVYDLVYNPRETQLIRDARAVGLVTISGIGMLVEQAALAFEKWTGCSDVQGAMAQALEEE